MNHLSAGGDVGPPAQQVMFGVRARRPQQLGDPGREQQAQPVASGRPDRSRPPRCGVGSNPDPARTAALSGEDEPPELVRVARPPVGRERPQLPLVPEVPEAEELGERGFEHPERVREGDAIQDVEIPVAPEHPNRRHTVAEAADREAGSLLEGRQEEGARHERLVMLDAVDLGAQGIRRDAQRARGRRGRRGRRGPPGRRRQNASSRRSPNRRASSPVARTGSWAANRSLSSRFARGSRDRATWSSSPGARPASASTACAASFGKPAHRGTRLSRSS